MKVNEIKDICLSGSKIYYNYLANKKNGGVEEIDVSKIDQVNTDTFKLKITKKLFDAESIYFRYTDNEIKFFTSDDIKIKVYDNDQRVLVVKVSSKVLLLLQNNNPDKWKLIKDLKFLVQRVIDWYMLNGDQLVFHPGHISHNIQFDENVFIPEKGNPSDEQRKAIETIFECNFSYIWGAPGTGKTRFVLSYALLNYIKQKKKVLILAPTNVALEQIFSGVIEMTDAAGIDRKQLLRLGFPSKPFANDFGEICELQGIEKELKLLNEQIKIISSILGIDTEEEKEIKLAIQQLEMLKKFNQEKDYYFNEEHDQKKKLKESESILIDNQYRIKALHQEREIILHKKNSLIGKVLGFLTKKIDYDNELDLLIEKEKTFDKKIKDLENIRSSLKLNISNLSENYSKKQVEVDSLANKIKNQFTFLKFHFKNIDIVIKELNETIKSKKEEAEILQSLSQEYQNLNTQELNNRLKMLQTERDRLLKYSLEERLQNVNIVGATLDTYLYRFKQQPLTVDHIFIDEAGYASIVKTLTVFTSKTPITLLGDHKQLLPVCELSKLKIEENKNYIDAFVWDQSAIYLEELWTNENKLDILNKYFKSETPSFDKLRKSALTTTYRFGPNLTKTLSQYVYTEDGFSSYNNDNTEVIICKVANPLNLRNKGRLNEAEAQCIKDYVYKYHSKDKDFAILAPYNDQIKRLKQLLPDLKDEDRILTVHKSQGREWNTVIFSVCDIGNERTPFFTDTTLDISNGLNNVNTAVSRTRKKLVIFCSYNDWESKQEQLIAGLLKSATHVISYDTSSLESNIITSHNTKNKINTTNSRQNNSSVIRGKNYVPSKPDEQWESKLLYWSKKRLPGYRYSRKKDAWWKKKSEE